MNPKFFIGIDISKLTLDFAILYDNKVLHKVRIENSEKAVVDLLRKLRRQFNCKRTNTLLCGEHTGVYGTHLVNGCFGQRYSICLENPLQIKLSLGIQRGKKDAVDAVRIARFASQNHFWLRRWHPPRKPVSDLKILSTTRKRLVKVKVMLRAPERSDFTFFSKEKKIEVRKYSKATVSSVLEDIELVESKMDKVIEGDSRLSRLVEIMMSVPGIGKVISTEIIIATNEFLNFDHPKQFACYCGIAPFEYSSGTSLRLKPRVSQMANKEVKMLLHIAAMSVLSRKGSLFSNYYARMVKAGKHKMSVLNALRNKMVHIIFACVRDDELFYE